MTTTETTRQRGESTPLPPSLSRLEPYAHDVELGDGSYTAPDLHRVRDLHNLLFPSLLRMCGGDLSDMRVLDLACNCGGFSFLANRYGAEEVIGIDAREHHIEQARAISAHLGVDSVRFEVGRVEDIDAASLGRFDLILMLGILYHLQDPIGTMRLVSKLGAPIIALDSHVHFTTDADEEDSPRWWMAYDLDAGLPDGLFGEDVADEWTAFQATTPVDYGSLPCQFRGSPQSQREREFVAARSRSAGTQIPASLGSAAGDLVLVPNRRAVIDLIRHEGYEDVVEIVPHRFSPAPFLGRYRVCLIASRRSPEGSLPSSLTQLSRSGGAQR